MIFRWALFLSGMLLSLVTWSQRIEKKEGHQKNDNLSQSFDAFLFSADYASNTNVLGNFSAKSKQPYYSPSLSFFSKWGLDMSIMGYAVGNSDDSLDHFTTELDLIVGYSFEPLKNLVIYPNYSHFLYSRNSNSMKSMFTDDFHLDMDYTIKFADLGVSAGYLTGKQHTFYAAAHNYYMINFDRVLFRKGYLSLEPGIDANFGDFEYLNLYYLDELTKNADFSNYMILNPVVRRYVRYQKLRNPDLTRGQILYNYLQKKAKDTFKFTSASINLPISYSVGNFSLNLGFYVFIPVHQPDYLNDDIQFFFNIGVNYMLIFD
jgi:hypothetical protein